MGFAADIMSVAARVIGSQNTVKNLYVWRPGAVTRWLQLFTGVLEVRGRWDYGGIFGSADASGATEMRGSQSSLPERDAVRRE